MSACRVFISWLHIYCTSTQSTLLSFLIYHFVITLHILNTCNKGELAMPLLDVGTSNPTPWLSSCKNNTFHLWIIFHTLHHLKKDSRIMKETVHNDLINHLHLYGRELKNWFKLENKVLMQER